MVEELENNQEKKLIDIVCEYCQGTGEVFADEFDPDSGQYIPGTLTEKCICQIEEPADFSGASDEIGFANDR